MCEHLYDVKIELRGAIRASSKGNAEKKLHRLADYLTGPVMELAADTCPEWWWVVDSRIVGDRL